MPRQAHGLLVSGQCLDKNYYATGTYADGTKSKLYAALSVNPPAQTLTVSGPGVSCTTLPNGLDKECVFSQPGTFTATFNFAATYGNFYAAEQRVSGRMSPEKGQCTSNGNAMEKGVTVNRRASAGPYQLSVPQQTIPVTLTVSSDDDTNADGVGAAPTSPALAAVGSASCTAETPYAISMSATDPQGDQIRYGIDWNGDGIIDQFIPAVGYVSSGTSQTASRTFSSAGTKTVNVLAEDAGGHDSAFASLSFDCVSDDARGNADGFSGNGIGNAAAGNGGGGSSLAPDLQIRAVPSLVRAGDASLINWSASGVVSCAVSGSDGEAWAGIQSPVGGERSIPIMRQTTFTLSCRTALGSTLTKTTSVSILPSWLEI